MADFSDRICTDCGKEFAKPSLLKRHKERKTPCRPVVEAPGEGISCQHCGRIFTTRQAVSRHVRKNCKIAGREIEHKTESLQAQVAELTALLKNQLAINASLRVYTAPVTTNIFNINPWDGKRRIDVDIGDIVAAFAENEKLQEYSRLGDSALTDSDIASPFVTELLVDLTKRAHSNPEARNVYLDPDRSDQVLVHKKNGTWTILPLIEAIQLMFDGVATSIHRTVMTTAEREQLPVEAQNALSMADMLYKEEREEYAKLAKAPMAAHLKNCRRAMIPNT